MCSATLFSYLLVANKTRCAVLVHQLVAAICVNMAHFCAVNIQRHSLLINPQSFGIQSWTTTQDSSEGSKKEKRNKKAPSLPNM